MQSCCFLRRISGATAHAPRRGIIGENVSTSQVWRKQMCARAQINSLHSKSYSRLAWSIPNVVGCVLSNTHLDFSALFCHLETKKGTLGHAITEKYLRTLYETMNHKALFHPGTNDFQKAEAAATREIHG
jgi:hypothetical protein